MFKTSTGKQVNAMITLTFVFLFIGFVVVLLGTNFLALNYQKQRIRQSAEKRGWRVLTISYRYKFNLVRRQDFEVDFTDGQGRAQSATCWLIGIFDDVHWNG